MSKEHAQLTQMLTEPTVETDGSYKFTLGQAGANTLILMESGIGKVNAAVGATTLIRCCHPDAIISTGCAGGIDERLNVMDVVVSTAVAYHDVIIPGCEPGQVQGFPARFDCDVRLLRAATAIPNPTTPIHAGLICSGDQFISDHGQLSQIKSQHPDALAVDMESAAIAHTCFLHNLPFLSFRILSDTPGADAHFQQYLDFWSQMAQRSFSITRQFLNTLPSQLDAPA